MPTDTERPDGPATPDQAEGTAAGNRTGQAPGATGSRPAVDVSGSRRPLDYYLVVPGHRAPAALVTPVSAAATVDGIVVEEFVFDDDHTTVGLDTACWSASDGAWRSSAALSRDLRGDPALRLRVVPVPRRDAEDAYRLAHGRELPGEPALRTLFTDRLPVPGSAPLRLEDAQVPEGFHDKRLHRVLFAGDLTPGRLPALQAAWGMTLTGDAADPRTRVLGTARVHVAGDVFTWELRRVGPGGACALDLTACLATSSDAAIGPLLRRLTTTLSHTGGLIPVMVERFS
ncbi:hypothetical protein ABZT47_32865 [Sphaerisporangium sp. NPDC005289]|uniref:hypothetical protein n=1 Tax=Sphaerisporangium sp. NPDC005289 TaxID=3155247 RepID=UPI0033A6ABC1